MSNSVAKGHGRPGRTRSSVSGRRASTLTASNGAHVDHGQHDRERRRVGDRRPGVGNGDRAGRRPAPRVRARCWSRSRRSTGTPSPAPGTRSRVQGGGVFVSGGTTTLLDSILALNPAPSTSDGQNCFGAGGLGRAQRPGERPGVHVQPRATGDLVGRGPQARAARGQRRAHEDPGPPRRGARPSTTCRPPPVRSRSTSAASTGRRGPPATAGRSSGRSSLRATPGRLAAPTTRGAPRSWTPPAATTRRGPARARAGRAADPGAPEPERRRHPFRRLAVAVVLLVAVAAVVVWRSAPTAHPLAVCGARDAGALVEPRDWLRDGGGVRARRPADPVDLRRHAVPRGRGGRFAPADELLGVERADRVRAAGHPRGRERHPAAARPVRRAWSPHTTRSRASRTTGSRCGRPPCWGGRTVRPSSCTRR